MSTAWREQYLHRFYRSNSHWIDGTSEFHNLCASVIPPGSRILEVGAGPSNATSRFLATIGPVDGIDVDEEVITNAALRSAAVVKADQYPFEDDTFDACVSNYVIEHVAQPNAHLREIWRVLRLGGVYVFRTPNVYHYTGIVARLTPHWFHSLVANRLRGLSSGEHEPYPTHHRLNSQRAIKRYAADVGFHVERLAMVEKEPSYGMIARPLFLLLMGYERIVNMSETFGPLRSSIVCVLRKRSVA